MQSNKTSKKTSNPAEKTSTPATAVENGKAASTAAAPRVSRSSKEKSDVTDMASVKHHHKLSSTIVSSPAPAKPLNDTPSRTVHHHEIAELAYCYWAERGFIDGYPEEDWLRAEKTLSAR